MLYIFLLLLCFAPSHEVLDINCLRLNPRQLDAELEYVIEPGQYLNLTAEAFAESVALVSTRFKRIHVIARQLPSFFSETSKAIAQGLLLHRKALRTDTQIFLSIYSGDMSEDINKGFLMLKETYESATEANSGHESPLIAGLYVEVTMYNLTAQLELIEIVFGSKDQSKIPIGFLESDCLRSFRSSPEILIIKKFFSRLNFLTCQILTTKTPSPEEAADDVVRKCDEIRDTANSYNFTLEIMCLARYSSRDTANVVGSVEYFRTFWCRIVDELMRNESHAQFVMFSAFDQLEINDDKKLHEKNLLHTGWWRKRSGNASGWVQKVDELPGGIAYGKCMGECHLCTLSEECCAEMLCASFHPSQLGEPPRICRSYTSNCTHIFGTSQTTQVFGTLTIAVFSVVGFLASVLVSSVVGYLIFRRIKLYSLLSREEISHFFEGSYSSSSGEIQGNVGDKDTIYDLAYNMEMEVMKSNFVIYEDQLLGSGSFGVVTKGRMGDEEVAVKTTFPGVDRIYLKALMLELKVLLHLGRHENIVNLLGAHTKQLNSGKLYLFLELCSFGNLLKFLRTNKNSFGDDMTLQETSEEPEDVKISCKNLLLWSIQIAQAMQHLVEKNVIHGDIAARNILVFSRDKVKLTDFGLSRRLYEHSIYVKTGKEPLPWRHMSVEALRDMRFSAQSDVWAFGVTLWEIFTMGEVPYPGYTWSQEFVELLTDGLHPPRPPHAHPLVYEMMTICWTLDVKLRPPVTFVCSNLESALDDITH